MKYIQRIFSILLLACIAFIQLDAQGSRIEFGKNDIQHKKMKWKKFVSPNFITYWYEGGEKLGKFVVHTAEKDIEELQNTLEYRISQKIRIMVFNDLSDFHQTNMGDLIYFGNNGGMARILGNKIYVYFDGNHDNFQQQVRKGIATVYVNQMMFGNNFQEIVQNAVLMNLPQWFTDGLVSFVGEEWNADLDNKLRDGILSGRYADFNTLIKENPTLAGHSLWYYISQHYGEATVSNLLYMTRINRSVESGFLYVIGQSFQQTAMTWHQFYNERYDNETAIATEHDSESFLNKKDKKLNNITQVAMNPNGKQVAWVSNNDGRYKVHLADAKGENVKVIVQGGLRVKEKITDNNYPILTWGKNAAVLTIVYEKADKIKIDLFDTEKNKGQTFTVDKSLERIFSANYVSGRRLVISALQDGQVDLFTINNDGAQLKRHTRDVYDEIDPIGIEIDGRKGILFASNRQTTTLQDKGPRVYLEPKNYDLYFLESGKNDGNLLRITNTPYADERYPVQIDDKHFGYLGNESGINNRYVGKLGTETNNKLQGTDATTWANTNNKRNILIQSVAPKQGKVADLVLLNGQYRVFVKDVKADEQFSLIYTSYRQQLTPKAVEEKLPEALNNQLEELIGEPVEPEEIEEVIPEEKPAETPENETKEEQPKEEEVIDIDSYFFQSEFDNNETPTLDEKEEEIPSAPLTEPIPLEKAAPKKEKKAYEPIEIAASEVVDYKQRFKTDFFTVQMNNDPLFDGMEDYFSSSLFYEYNPMGLLVTSSISDIMEDHRIFGGVRIPIPAAFTAMEYFLIYENKKRRLDQRYSYYRRAYRNSSDLGFQLQEVLKTTTNLASVELRYPFNVYNSLRVIPKIRTDRNVIVATEFNSINDDVIMAQRASLRLEYVFDNTTTVYDNILNGTRLKVYGEFFKRFDLNLTGDPSFELRDGLMKSIGVDARHYLKLDRHTIIATRIAAATSFGSEKIKYFLGGVDNWVLPIGTENRSNLEIPVGVSNEYAYQTLATNLRGFQNNIRNGNSYAVWNTEVRVPVFKYLAGAPIKSSIINNFQIIGFFDIGTAWEGKSPFSEDNPLNTSFIGSDMSPISVTVNYFRNPVVMGYGFGVRTRLLSYFVRLDYGWGIETGQIQPGVFYLSLGTDF